VQAQRGLVLALEKMQRPTAVHYFFAADWPIKIWFGTVPLLFFGMLNDVNLISLFSDLGYFFQNIVHVILLSILVFLCSAVIGWPIIGTIYHYRELENGGPFKVGDYVQILVGANKGKVAQVYSTWQGSSVRVDLGQDLKDELKDIFSSTQLIKEKNTL
jgi:hypothetical protein